MISASLEMSENNSKSLKFIGTTFKRAESFLVVFLPFILFPVVIWVAAQNVFCGVLVFTALLWVKLYAEWLCTSLRLHRRFFFMWSLTSVIYLWISFENQIRIQIGTVLKAEDYLFVLSTFAAAVCGYIVSELHLQISINKIAHSYNELQWLIPDSNISGEKSWGISNAQQIRKWRKWYGQQWRDLCFRCTFNNNKLLTNCRQLQYLVRLPNHWFESQMLFISQFVNIICPILRSECVDGWCMPTASSHTHLYVQFFAAA